MPWAPLICTSMNPGTIQPPRRRRRRAPSRRRRRRRSARRRASTRPASSTPSGVTTRPPPTITTDIASRPSTHGEHGAEAAERRVGAGPARPGGRGRGRRASATSPRRPASAATSSAPNASAGRVIPPPTATTSTSSVMTHSCTAHAVAATTSWRRLGSSVDGAPRPDRLGAADLPAPARRRRRDRIGTWPISPAPPVDAAPQPAGEHEAGGDPRADVDVGQRLRRRQAEVGERAEGGGVDVVLDVHRHADARRRRARRSSTGPSMPRLTAELTTPRGVVDAPGHPDGDGGRRAGDVADEAGDVRRRSPPRRAASARRPWRRATRSPSKRTARVVVPPTSTPTTGALTATP